MNVWEKGLMNSGVRLVAQTLGPFPFWLGAVDTPGGEWMCSLVNLGGDLGWFPANIQPPPTRHRRFPFGFAVVPD